MYSVAKDLINGCFIHKLEKKDYIRLLLKYTSMLNYERSFMVLLIKFFAIRYIRYLSNSITRILGLL
jgi:hypothetical protein